MHATLSELLENVHPGMPWVAKDGVARFANRRATTLSGQSASRAPRWIMPTGAPKAPGDAVPELRCKVLPRLSTDDAIVLITDNSEDDGAIGFDNPMMVIRSDMRDPVKDLTQALVRARNERDTAAIDALCDKTEAWSHTALRDSGAFAATRAAGR